MNSKIIYEMISGSMLYGTNTPSSDEDIVGVYVPDKEYLFGLQNQDEIDLSIVSKDISGKNNSEAIDKKYYSIKKFVKLCLENNPNIIEMLFTNKENIKIITPEIQIFLDNKEKFLSKRIVKTFIGYSYSQKNKMMIKSDKVNEMIQILEYFKTLNPKQYIVELKTDQSFQKILNSLECAKINKKGYQFYFKEQHLSVGDIDIPLNVFVKNAISRITERLSKSSYRQDYILKSGYDTKFAHHAVRLLLEGKELLATNNLNFPLNYKDILLDIKTGNWKVQDVIKYADELEIELKKLEKNSFLPEEPDFNYINNILINILFNHYYNCK